ncbi:MAG: coiled-coil domain-containing protein [Nitrososphaerota archaeon]
MKAGFALAVFALVGMIAGTADAKLATPFEYSTNGVEITNYELDNNDMVLALDVKVTDTKGSLELTLDRNLIDSKHNGKDDIFLVIADGDEVFYKETKTTQKNRTLKFNLSPGVELVEIFGSHVNGITFSQYEQPIINIQNDQLQKIVTENSILKEKNTKLLNEVDKLKAENDALKKENKKLDSRIFELENLVSAMDKKVKDLNAVVSEQVKTMYKWFARK